jgi:hypothetical protein
MDLVEDHQTVFVRRENRLGVTRLLSVAHVLEIEIDGSSFRGDLERQGGLSHLPRADERDRRLPGQGGRQQPLDSPLQQPCKSTDKWKIFMVNPPASPA